MKKHVWCFSFIKRTHLLLIFLLRTTQVNWSHTRNIIFIFYCSTARRQTSAAETVEKKLTSFLFLSLEIYCNCFLKHPKTIKIIEDSFRSGPVQNESHERFLFRFLLSTNRCREWYHLKIFPKVL